MDNKEAYLQKIDGNEWKRFIVESNLSVRATNVLLKNFDSLDELIACDRSKLFQLKNCGVKTVFEIIHFIEYLKETGIVDSTIDVDSQNSENSPESCRPLSLKTKLSLPPDNDTIQLLPVFNTKTLEEITVGDLHPDFKPFIPLSDIVFSARLIKILDRMGLKTIGDAMCTPGNKFLAEKNFGRKCYNELRQVLVALITEDKLEKASLSSNSQSTAHAPLPPESLSETLVDNPQEGGFHGFSSYENMVEYFIKSAIKAGRNQKIMIEWFCFQEPKPPTLKALGEKHQITRERVRQIVKKSVRILSIKSNIDNLAFFWNTVKTIITRGGGVIHLHALANDLCQEFNWQQKLNPLALGQLLSLWLPETKLKKTDDIVEINSICLNCPNPQQFIGKLNFDANASFHIKVVSQKMLEDCQNKCEINPLPVNNFHKAFIEKIIPFAHKRLVINNDLVYPYKQWALTQGDNLEDAVYYVLKDQDQPMHYSEIAQRVRELSSAFADITDHNLHAAIGRYKSIELVDRGTFALKEWGVDRYRPVSEAVEQLLQDADFPMKREQIISELKDEFSEGNITTALSERTTRFVAIGEGFYDYRRRWEQRSTDDLISHMPEPLRPFANYIVTNNNCSYKPVLALILIRSIKEDGAMEIPKLKDRFYNFYASRHARGLVVENNDVMASQINLIEPHEFKNRALLRPIESFCNSGYFSKEGAFLKLRSDIAGFITNGFRETVIVVLLKAIHQYFSAVAAVTTEYSIQSETSNLTQEVHDGPSADPKKSLGENFTDKGEPEISIKKSKRRKIKL